MINEEISRLLSFEESLHIELNRLCRPLFGSDAITSFSYLHFRDDNKFIQLCTHKSWTMEYLTGASIEVDNCFQEQMRQALQHMRAHPFLWPEKTEGNPTLKKLVDFGLWNGFTIYKRDNESTHAWAFTGNLAHTNINDFYLRNMDRLWDFCQSFVTYLETKYSDDLEKVYISLHNPLEGNKQSESQADKLPAIIIPTKKVKLFTPTGSIMISRKDWQTLELIAKGLGSKQIASWLNISPRSVESRVVSLRDRLGAFSKDKLVAIYEMNKLNL
jgi:DNA-binding CsgD family transcriptional regulator